MFHILSSELAKKSHWCHELRRLDILYTPNIFSHSFHNHSDDTSLHFTI